MTRQYLPELRRAFAAHEARHGRRPKACTVPGWFWDRVLNHDVNVESQVVLASPAEYARLGYVGIFDGVVLYTEDAVLRHESSDRWTEEER